MPLRDVIHDFLQQRRGEMSEAAYEDMLGAVLAMAEGATTEHALRTDDAAPGFALPDIAGARVTLDALRARGPVVLSFYRGVWCPFCNMELDALQQALPEITGRGAALVAISPQTPEHSEATVAKNHLTFPVLSDPGNAVAHRYGLVFQLDDAGRAFHHAQGSALPPYNGDDSWELPVPGTYVVAPDGRIAWSFIDGNFTERAEPADILAALDDLLHDKSPAELEV